MNIDPKIQATHEANSKLLLEAKAKWERLNELTTHTDACGPRPTMPPYNDDDHDANQWHLRLAFIDAHESNPFENDAILYPDAQGPEVLEIVRWLFALGLDGYDGPDSNWNPYRQQLTEMALSMSLCPMHLVDYAICFDDEDDECKVIREFFPDHDS